MCHGNKELTAGFTRLYQELLIIMHIFRSFIEVSESKFSISLASFPTVKICDFGQQFLLGSYLLRFAQNDT